MPVKNIKTNNKLGEQLSVKISRMKPVIQPTVPHKHDGYHEIILLTKGVGFHTIELKSFPVKPPVVFILKPGQVHCWEFTEIPEGHVLMFKNSLGRSFAELPVNLLNEACIPIPEENVAGFNSLMSEIDKELETQSLGYQTIVIAHIQILLVKLSRIGSLPGGIREKTTRSLASRFSQLVEQHYKDLKQVKSYAEKLNITPKHLNDTCKRTIHQTASNVIAWRIELEAKRMLLHTEKSISEIAHELNFNDSSHFAKFFRKANNLSPKAYRKKRFQ